MDIEKTKKRIKKMVSTDIINVFRELENLLTSQRGDTYNDFLLLEGQFREFQKWSLRGVADAKEISRSKNDIRHRLMGFIDSLEKQDFVKAEWMLDYIYERIMVICKTNERIAYLQQFFPAQYFGSLRFDSSCQKVNVDDVDILIYDDTPSVQGEDDELLRYFIVDTSPVVLYFGRHSQLVWEHPEKAYATNSVFSLHARIREMIEYLKYRKAYQLQQNNS